ncbi:MAG: RNase adapter RapZ [Pseudomonadales bacterium]
MKLVIISGRSGSGKSTALRALEDAGFNCIDNFPVELLSSLVTNTLADPGRTNTRYAVCIDARSQNLGTFPDFFAAVDQHVIDCEIIFLDALTGTLIKRFSETRRRHPLTDDQTDLLQAIESEKGLLSNIADLADLTLDTTLMRGRELVEVIRQQVALEKNPGISVLFRSFGYKFGVPVDADLVFDIRCLPNPHWEDDLRPLTGLDQPVISYLDHQPQVLEMVDDITNFLERWIPRFEADNRSYMTVAIGCTGGQHRSVYMAEKLRTRCADSFGSVLVRHRESRA